MKLMITVLSLLAFSSAFAQATSEATPITTAPAASSEQTIWDRVKNAPIGLIISNDISSSNPNGKVNGFNNTTSLFSYYKLTDVDAVSVNYSYVVSDTTSSTVKNYYDGTTLKYKRSGLLTKDKHGVDMSADARYNFFPAATKSSSNLAGSASVRTGISKSFNPKFNGFFELRYDEYIRASSASNISRRKFIVYTAPSFQMTDKLSFSAGLSFTQVIKGEGAKNPNYVSFAPDISYSFTDKFGATIYWDSNPMASNDQRFFVPGWISDAALGLSLSYTIL